ncbi:MAG: helix-turn-helix transcriptional regulator [Arenibacterium sp.]
MIYEFGNLRQVDYALEATSSAFLPIADQLAEYNKMIAAGGGSNYDFEGLGATHRAPAFQALHDNEIWSIDQDYLQRPEVVAGIEALGALRRVLLNLSDDPSSFRGAIFLYDRKFDLRLPALTKKIGAHRLTADLRRRYNAALSVLDKIDTGVMILTDNAELILKNASADAILAAKDGLLLGANGRVTCRNSETDEEIRDAVRSIGRTAAGENDASGRFLTIPRLGADAPLVAILSPLRDAEMELERDLKGALLTLVDPLRPLGIREDLIAKVYGLTSAEQRLAGFLISGRTNKEIAEELGVSPETVKTQLSSVLQKSGCRNRLSFVWRMFQFSPPVL